jgi:hypothetical protein
VRQTDAFSWALPMKFTPFSLAELGVVAFGDIVLALPFLKVITGICRDLANDSRLDTNRPSHARH